MIHLQNNRLTLRPLTRDDTGWWQDVLSDARIAQNLSSAPHPFPDGLAAEYIEMILTAPKGICLIIEQGDTLVGNIGIRDLGDGIGGIGYWILPAFWGQGIVSEAIELLVGDAPSQGWTRLEADTIIGNVASEKALLKNGFVADGQGEVNSKFHGKKVAANKFAIDLPLAVLQDKTLSLRALKATDAPLMQTYVSDAKITQMLAVVPHPYPENGAEDFIGEVLNDETNLHLWTITKDNDDLRGVISINDKGDHLGELGYWIAVQHWGQGLASSALKLVVTHARKLDFNTLSANVHKGNLASVKVLTNNGFTQGEDGEGFSVYHDAMRPHWTYDLDLKASA